MSEKRGKIIDSAAAGEQLSFFQVLTVRNIKIIINIW